MYSNPSHPSLFVKYLEKTTKMDFNLYQLTFTRQSCIKGKLPGPIATERHLSYIGRISKDIAERTGVGGTRTIDMNLI